MLGGALMAGISYFAARTFYPGTYLTQLSVLPLAALFGSTILLWLMAREKLGQKLSQDSVLLLTVSFIYFYSPMQGSFRSIAMVAIVPCLVTLAFCLRKKALGENGRISLMLWAMLVSLVMGIHQLVASPESLMPPKHLGLGLSAGPYFYGTLLLAAGLVSLTLNLIPFIEWTKESLFGNPNSTDHQIESDHLGPKKLFWLTLFHALPLMLNWKFQYFSYESMLSYSLVWSPMLSASFVKALYPNERVDLPGWTPELSSDTTKVS